VSTLNRGWWRNLIEADYREPWPYGLPPPLIWEYEMDEISEEVKKEGIRKMDKHIEIVILLVGTEGQLDRADPEYRVLNLEDQAENTKQQILELVPKYENYGFTLIRAEKDVTDLKEQIVGYGELLDSANHDVEQLTKYANDLEAENKQLRQRLKK